MRNAVKARWRRFVMRLRQLKPEPTDLGFLAGIACLTYGIGRINLALACIVAGALLASVSILARRGARRRR